jgi:hypothetical protein
MSRFDKKIAEAEILVDHILEQGFSVNVAVANLKGNSDVEWTECYNRRCKTMQNEYDRKECKAQCEWSSYNILITRVNALRGRCRGAGNPDACLRKLQDEIDATREKQRKARADIATIRRAKAEQERDQAAKQPVRGEAQPTQ